MNRQEFAFYLMGNYIDTQPKTAPINRGVGEVFVRGGLHAWDWFSNSRDAEEEMNETFIAEPPTPPLTPEQQATADYLARRLHENTKK